MLCDCELAPGEVPYCHINFERRAILTYKCCECGEIILTGERHSVFLYAQEEGDPIEEDVTCAGCTNVQEVMGCFYYGMIYEQLIELAMDKYNNDLPLQFFDELSPGGREKVDKYVLANLADWDDE